MKENILTSERFILLMWRRAGKFLYVLHNYRRLCQASESAPSYLSIIKNFFAPTIYRQQNTSGNTVHFNFDNICGICLFKCTKFEFNVDLLHIKEFVSKSIAGDAGEKYKTCLHSHNILCHTVLE